MDAVNKMFELSTCMATDAYRGIAYYLIGKEAEPLVLKAVKPPPTTSMQSKSVGMLLQVFGNSSPWIRVAGLSGAIAVAMGAYAAHGNYLQSPIYVHQ